MLLHFVRRDFRDHRPYWGLLLVLTALYAAAGTVVPSMGMDILGTQLLGVAYFMFAGFGESWVMGSTWRSQHTLSRHYLLALPIGHKRLFAIQHLRVGVFLVPLFVMGALAPFLLEPLHQRLTTTLYLFHLFALLTSIGLFVESTIWMTLEWERLARYVPAGRRLWSWIKILGGMYLPLALLALGWFNLLVSGLSGTPPLYFPRQVALALAVPAWITFPACLVLAIIWIRHNARRWCVTL